MNTYDNFDEHWEEPVRTPKQRKNSEHGKFATIVLVVLITTMFISVVYMSINDIVSRF